MTKNNIFEGPQEKQSPILEKLVEIIDTFPRRAKKEIQEFRERISLLTTKAKELCDRLLGDWDFLNYINCLVYGPGDEEYERAYQKVISNPEVSKLFDNFQFSWKSPEEIELLKRLFVLEYFEDLIYFEISKIENKKEKKKFLVNGENYKHQTPENLSKIFNEEICLNHEEISFTKLSSLSVEQLKAIFKCLYNHRIISFENTDLGSIGNKKLKAIFENSQNWRSVAFQGTQLCDLKEEDLKVIFKYSKNWKEIYFVNEELGSLAIKELEVIFKNLNNCRNFSIIQCGLGYIDTNGLKIIFNNSANWKVVKISGNYLGNITEEDGIIIFENSKNWKIVSLVGSFTRGIEEERISMYLRNAKNWKEVFFELMDIPEKNMREFVKTLIPSTKITYT